MDPRPLIAVTIGDPASIGPEVVIKALGEAGIYTLCRPLIIGDRSVIERTLSVCGLKLSIHPVENPEEGQYQPGVLDLIDVQVIGDRPLIWGQVQPEAGRASFAYIHKAIELAMAGLVEAIVTAPINKVALQAGGIPYLDHTEILAALTRTPDPMTLFEVKGLRIAFLTRHVPLRKIFEMITFDRILAFLRRLAGELVRLGVSSPRIAVAALNPHAGEGGLLGEEEITIIRPAVEAAQREGIQVEGPLPADSVFWHAAQGRFDAVLSLYHDQGHIAAKMYDFEGTVALTLGLPFLRTSVDHGTAYDIAGKGIASPASMKAAIRAAARYARVYQQGAAFLGC